LTNLAHQRFSVVSCRYRFSPGHQSISATDFYPLRKPGEPALEQKLQSINRFLLLPIVTGQAPHIVYVLPQANESNFVRAKVQILPREHVAALCGFRLSYIDQNLLNLFNDKMCMRDPSSIFFVPYRAPHRENANPGQNCQRKGRDNFCG